MGQNLSGADDKDIISKLRSEDVDECLRGLELSYLSPNLSDVSDKILPLLAHSHPEIRIMSARLIAAAPWARTDRVLDALVNARRGELELDPYLYQTLALASLQSSGVDTLLSRVNISTDVQIEGNLSPVAATAIFFSFLKQVGAGYSSIAIPSEGLEHIGAEDFSSPFRILLPSEREGIPYLFKEHIGALAANVTDKPRARAHVLSLFLVNAEESFSEIVLLAKQSLLEKDDDISAKTPALSVINSGIEKGVNPLSSEEVAYIFESCITSVDRPLLTSEALRLAGLAPNEAVLLRFRQFLEQEPYNFNYYLAFQDWTAITKSLSAMGDKGQALYPILLDRFIEKREMRSEAWEEFTAVGRSMGIQGVDTLKEAYLSLAPISYDYIRRELAEGLLSIPSGCLKPVKEILAMPEQRGTIVRVIRDSENPEINAGLDLLYQDSEFRESLSREL